MVLGVPKVKKIGVTPVTRRWQDIDIGFLVKFCTSAVLVICGMFYVIVPTGKKH